MNVKPSPCQLASTSLTIDQALATLEQTGSSYLLLLDENQDLSGILTKTDIIKAIRFLRTDPKYFDREVATIMQRQVKSLPLELMHTAPEFMLRHGIEHVPVTEISRSTQRQHIVGVITSDLVFEYMVKLRRIPPIFGGETQTTKRQTLCVLSADGATYRLLHSVFSESKYVEVIRMHFSGFNPEALKIDALILDIDEVQDRIWLPILKNVVTADHPGAVFVIYTPDQHENAKQALTQLEIKGLLEVYSKPIDLTRLTVDLEKAWAKN